MDTEFVKALQASVQLWIDTGREGLPNVCFPIDKLEGFLAHLHSVTTERDAALYQMRENAQQLDNG